MTTRDYTQMFTSTQRTGRKPRWCASCGERLQIGDRYVDNRAIWDGEWGSCPQCVECAALYFDRYEWTPFESMVVYVKEDERQDDETRAFLKRYSENLRKLKS